MSGRLLCVTGTHLSAVDIVTGKQVWRAENPKPPEGQVFFWGAPTLHGGHVYVSAREVLLRFDLRTGRPSDWVCSGLAQCDPHSPLVIQGNGLWSVAVNRTEGGINVLSLVPENETTWVFRIVKNPEAYWIGGDADRVALMDGTTLTALPVF
ncbi:PQQ-binding-like beta-propeller repeat protein [Streptomyces cinereoruber]|uniref:hypothetical protein n=1 Tax=Streptomyces cinereoruber TaxID=67260 RepID=UPI0036918A11